MTRENESYEATFRALELLAAASNIDMRRLHHRYHASTAVHLLRREAARLLQTARDVDKETCRKVWLRHRCQATA